MNRLASAFLAVALTLSFSNHVSAQGRYIPRRNPEVPVAPLQNPQAPSYNPPQGTYYNAPQAPFYNAPQTPYYNLPQAPVQVPQTQPNQQGGFLPPPSNRCYLPGLNSYVLLQQYAPTGSACWASDSNNNVYNGVVQ